jgi:antitoxin (DNA-binding transcriptional repressor) of toxin-antitoxin stability system
MQTVSVGKLRSDLNRYLEDVKSGEEVLIKERNRTIAKIVPMDNDDDDELAQLVAEGVLSPPKISKIPDSFWDEELPDISLETVVKAITDEREED